MKKTSRREPASSVQSNPNVQHLPVRWQAWFEPDSQDPNACGQDLEYDPQLLVLQTQVQPQQDAQYGDFVAPAQNINWREVEQSCLNLLDKGRDLRVLVVLLRARMQQQQAEGLAQVMALISLLYARYTPQLHPQHTVDGETDLQVRANALAALAQGDTVLAELRKLAVDAGSMARLTVRDVHATYALPRQATAEQAQQIHAQLSDLWQKQHPTVLALQSASQHLHALQTSITQDLGAHAPNLSALQVVLSHFAHSPQLTPTLSDASQDSTVTELAQQAHTSVPGPSEPVLDTTTPSQASGHVLAPLGQTHPSHVASAVAPASRQHASQLIDLARQWFESQEPSSPVADLLRQAQRLIGKTYLEVFEAVPADLLLRWRNQQDEGTQS